MPPGFPCPNPACTHLFAPDAVQGVAALACPRCGTRYRFRNPTPPPPLPTAAPPPVPRLAAPVAGSELAFAPDSGPLIRPRLPRRGGLGWLRVLAVFLTVTLGVAGVLYYYRDELGDMLQDGPGQCSTSRKTGNFAFRAVGWLSDEALREKMRANLAVSLPKPRAHMALFYLDHQVRSFSNAQLLDKALRQLRSYFPRFEYEDPFSGENDGRTDTLAGEPALVFTFSATDPSDVPMRGQAYVLSRQGYTYWLYFWGPEDNYDELTDRWEVLRAGFKLYDEREGWKPRPREVRSFVGSGYEVRYFKDVWKAETNPKDADPACELFLRGIEGDEDERTGRRRAGEPTVNAPEVMALVLPKAADAKAAVLEHVKKRLIETNPMLKVELLPERGKAKSAGQADRLKLALSPDHERFALVSVMSQPDAIVALVCECRWDRKEYWEQEFRAIAESVRAAKPPEAKPDDS